MKKLAFVLAILLILLCSCRFIPGPRETETGTESVATESETETETGPETEQATETETEQATEPADTAPSITPDPEGDAAAYAKIAAKAEDDVRFRFVKAYIDGDGEEMVRTLWEVDYYPGGAAGFSDWVKAFEEYRGSFEITRYDAFDGTETNEYGAEVERVVFTFSVYETGNDKVPVGEKEMIITGSYMDGTVWVTVPALEEKNAALRSLIPSDADLLWWAIPIYGMIADGYTDGWDRDMVIMDTIFLTIPDHDYTNGAPGMTADQLRNAAKELFGISAFNLTEPAAYVGDDGLYHVGGHGGIASFYEVLSAEKDGDGFIVRMRLFADKAYLVPSDEYEIRIKPSGGLYDLVFDYVKVLEHGEISPYFFEN